MIASNFPKMEAAPIRALLRTVAANGEETFDVFGAAFYIKEAEYGVEVAFDNGDWMAWDLAIGVDFSRFGFTFRKVRIRNLAAAANRVEAYAGFFTLDDRRLNVVESRNGSAASHIPPGFAEVSHTFVSGAAVQLLPLDLNRAEVWLAADTFGTAWFGADQATMDGASGNADFRRVGFTLDAWTKLRTKAPIWVRGDVGATVRALVFSY